MNYSKAEPSNYLPWCSRLPTTNERLEDRPAHNHKDFGERSFVYPSLKDHEITAGRSIVVGRACNRPQTTEYEGGSDN